MRRPTRTVTNSATPRSTTWTTTPGGADSDRNGVEDFDHDGRTDADEFRDGHDPRDAD